jgi:hypothetical protein
VISALASFFGGLVAVFIGMILRVYRTDIQNKNELRSTITLTSEYASGGLTNIRSEKNKDRVAKKLEKAYIEYDYLLTPRGKSTIGAALRALDRYEDSRDEEEFWSQISLDIGSVSEGYLSDMDKIFFESDHEKIREVTWWGSVKRFFGRKDAYEMESEVELIDIEEAIHSGSEENP